MLSVCLFALGVLFVFIGLIQLLGKRSAEMPGIRPSVSRPPAPVLARTRASVQSQPLQGVVMKDPQTWNKWKVGDRLHLMHPTQGELLLHVNGRLTYAELWQRGRGPQVPWTPTGNTFYGFWMETNRFLLNWLNRYYVFDEMVPTSDVEIQRDFAPYARQFAQSDQTAEVHFSYPPAVWKIEDIGKFRIERVEGSVLLSVRVGAVGRFIHAIGDSKRALAVEDYEGGAGQDVVWIGYQIAAEDLRA
jgi:hypothetical protein